jgi:hypothetical protein
MHTTSEHFSQEEQLPHYNACQGQSYSRESQTYTGQQSEHFSQDNR